jgi:UDP-N-acetylmuramoylalanine--D-glutamate ligase
MDFIDLAVFHKNKNSIIAVIEASNMQLEHAVLVRPTYFIITNLYQNHLNSHNSYELYIEAKLSPVIYNSCYIKNIIVDFIAHKEINAFFPSLLSLHSDKIIFIDTFEQRNIPNYSFPNNWKTVGIILSLFNKYQDNFYSLFQPPMLPHFRLEKIYDKENIFIYNDSKSTIIEATLSAINTIIRKHQNSLIYTIIGGLSKGVCRLNGVFALDAQSYKLVLFGKEAQNLSDNYAHIYGKKLTLYHQLEDTIRYVKEDIDLQCISNPGIEIVVLFSPGGASFDFFESYVDRGNQFNSLIEKIFIKKK